jgi:hypothetical protein
LNKLKPVGTAAQRKEQRHASESEGQTEVILTRMLSTLYPKTSYHFNNTSKTFLMITVENVRNEKYIYSFGQKNRRKGDRFGDSRRRYDSFKMDLKLNVYDDVHYKGLNVT